MAPRKTGQDIARRDWRPKHPSIFFENMDSQFSKLKGYAALTPAHRAQLFSRLCKARRQYDIRLQHQMAPAPTAAAREIREIRKSISRIATFAKSAIGDPKSQTATARAALHGMKSAAEAWAAEKCTKRQDALPPGFDPISSFEGKDHDNKTYTAVDYGSGAFLCQFFQASSFMKIFAKAAEVRLKQQSKTQFSHSAIEWIAGKQLPEIYTCLFKLPFTLTAETATSKASDGIQFVDKCT